MTAYAIIHRKNWPIQGKARIETYPTRAEAEKAIEKLHWDTIASSTGHIRQSDMKILEVKNVTR